jgi:hypothetical protein
MAEAYDPELLRLVVDEALRENASANLLELAEIVGNRLKQIAAKKPEGAA